MAWRIEHNVVRGEIDNRVRGRVTGRVWLKGEEEPLILDLTGNACSDLAGCLLTFENRGEVYAMRSDAKLAQIQNGTIGDLTASRKVRVFDMPVKEAYVRKKQKLPVPEHMANCLYLEWFSQGNGRVVIESPEYNLTVSAPAWRLTPQEEERRQHDAASGFSGFMQKVSDALEAKKHEPPEDKQWDEFEYEKFMRECDARTDKYSELLDKYMDHPDREQIIAKEMGWTWLEEAMDDEKSREQGEGGSNACVENESAGDESEEGEGWDVPDDLPDPVPVSQTKGVDWVEDEDGSPIHPLTLRAREGAMRLWHETDELGLDECEDEDLGDLIGEYQITGAKLAGALDSLAYGREFREGAFVVACLKRALGHLHAAQAALDRVTHKKMLPVVTLERTRGELFGLREEILRLMTEFRQSPE